MNILVTVLFDLGGDFETIGEIHDLCSASFERNLQGMDKHVVLTGQIRGGAGTAKEIRNYRYGMMLADVWHRVYRLVRRGNDVMVADGDILCVKPTPWPEAYEFRMFNLANARVPYAAFPKAAYMHSGIRLLPASLSLETWAVGAQLVETWDYGCWAYDQYVWNRMYWMQDGKRFEDAASYCDPRYCWCTPVQYDNLGVPRSDAYIIHYHETRGMQMCLRQMRHDA